MVDQQIHLEGVKAESSDNKLLGIAEEAKEEINEEFKSRAQYTE